MITLKESMASITISGTETVQFENGYYKYAAISNTGGSDIYVSAKNSECTAPGDGTICIQPGASTVIRIYDDTATKEYDAKLYIRGKGTIQLIGQYDNRNPFKSAPTADGGVQESGNPIQMDGLQGGVPFSEMVVSGKNLIGIAQAKALSGNETNGYNVIDSSSSRTIIQKLQPNTTYTVKRYDSGNRFRIILFNNEPSTTPDTTAKQLVINSDGSITEYTFTTDTANLWFAFTTNYAVSGDAVEPIVQLEYGSSPTAYEPPITGRELQVNVSGKNLIPYPYIGTTKTVNGITFTDNGDGTITANGTATGEATFPLKKVVLYNGKYTLSGCTDGYSDKRYAIQFAKSDWSFGFVDYGNGSTNQIDETVSLAQARIIIHSGTVCDNLIFKPQLELGSAATDYEPYHGSTTTITPDSNPYTIPNDIRQVDGLNNISVSEGELSVTGVRKNAAIKRIWDEIDEIKTAIIVSNGESE